MKLESLNQDATQIRRDNVVDIDIGSHLIRTNLALGETLLPPEYREFRERVRRWRDLLRDGGEQLLKERAARRRASEIFEIAARMDEQIKATETAKGWARVSVP